MTPILRSFAKLYPFCLASFVYTFIESFFVFVFCSIYKCCSFHQAYQVYDHTIASRFTPIIHKTTIIAGRFLQFCIKELFYHLFGLSAGVLCVK
jgi:hypothetical protein